MDKTADVYILASSFRRLYVGITNDLEVRVRQHKEHRNPTSFTARYGIDRLVYFERYAVFTQAIAREKDLKLWGRQRKIALIVKDNPTWRDLSEEWGKPIVFCESELGQEQMRGSLRFAQDDGERQGQRQEQEQQQQQQQQLGQQQQQEQQQAARSTERRTP